MLRHQVTPLSGALTPQSLTRCLRGGFFFEERMNQLEDARRRWRSAAVEGRALVALLTEEQAARRPKIDASDREIGRWIGLQDLVDRLNKLLDEAARADRNPSTEV